MPVIRKYKGKCAQFLKGIPGLSSSEREQLLNKLVRFIEVKNKGLYGKKMDKSIKDFARRMRDEYRVDLTNRMNIDLRNIETADLIHKRLDRFGDDAVDGVLAILRGSNRTVKGAKDSINMNQVTYFMQWKSSFIDELQKAGVDQVLKSNKFDRKIMNEYYRQFTPLTKKSSKNAQVVKIAEIMHKYDTIIVNKLNASGARIDRHPGFLFRMGHDRDKIRIAEFEGWRKSVDSFLDHEAMKLDLEMPYETFLRNIYDDLRSGSFLRARGSAESNSPLGFLSSTANTARKVSTQNRLKFINGKSHHDYLKLFGNEHVHVADSLIYAFEQASRNVALMEALGPNPRNMLQGVLRDRADKVLRKKTLSKKRKEQFDDKVGGLPRQIDATLKDLDGSVRVPADEMWAQFYRNSRVIHNVALLGNILFKSVNDFATILATSRHAGQPLGDFITTKVDAVASLFKDASEARQFAKAFGIGQESLTGDLVSMTGTNDIFHGAWAKGQRHFFKYSGIARWNDALKSAYAMSLSGHLGSMAKNIPNTPSGKRFKRMLRMYDIDEVDWEFLRKTVWSDKEMPGLKSQGRQFITPDRIKEMPDELITVYLRQKGVVGKEIKPITEYTKELDAVKKRLGDWKKTRRKQKLQSVQDLEDEIQLLESSQKEHQTPLFEARQSLKRIEDQVQHNKKLEEKHSIHSKEYAKKAFDIDKQERRKLKIEIERREAALEKLSDQVAAKNTQIKEEIANRELEMETVIIAEDQFKNMKKGGGQVGVQEVEGFTIKQINDARDKLAQRVSVLIQDNNDSAIIIPGARERTAFNRGNQPGTVPGEIGRMLGQFKTFPLAVYTKHLERDMMAGGSKSVLEGLKKIGQSKGADIVATTQFVGVMTAYGALGLAMTDKFTTGRTQRDWTDPDSWFQASISGGSLGLYTDFILGPYATDRNFNAWGNFLGPVANTLSDTTEMMQAAISGDPFAQKLVNIMHNVTPFANLFYLRRIFDYLVWYNLKETIAPGSLRKMERRLEKETGQEMTGGIFPGIQDKPSSVIAHGGGFR